MRFRLRSLPGRVARVRPAGLAAGVAVLCLLAFPPARSEAQTGPLLTRDQAINQFLSVVSPSNPAYQNAAAFLYQRDAPADSLLFPGQVVAPWDSSFVYPIFAPTYLFWVDLDTGLYWDHPALFGFMDAASGNLQLVPAQSWPVVDGQEVQRFLADGNASPEKLFGGYLPIGNFVGMPPIPLTPTGTWGLIIAGKNLEGPADSSAIAGDVERVKQLLNRIPQGPRIPSQDITVVGMDDASGTGATAQAICDSVNALPKSCAKLYVVYVGHGYQGGITVAKDGGGHDRLSYEKLSEKLGMAYPDEACILIMACYSGSAVGEMQKRVGLKGVVATSSSGGQPTDRQPDGSPFMKHLLECWTDPGADLDGHKPVTLVEAVAWARAKSDTVRNRDPQVGTLGDGRKVTFPPPEITGHQVSSDDGGGSIDYQLECVSYGIRRGAANGRDSVVTRPRIYVFNNSGANHRAHQAVDIVCYDARGRELGRITRTPMLRPGERRCLTQTDPACRRIAVVRHGHKPGLASLAAELPSGSVVGPRATVYDPGEFIYEENQAAGIPGQTFTASVDAIPGWGLSIQPDTLTLSAEIDTETVVVRGAVPDTATVGGVIHSRIADESGADTLYADFHALLHDSLAAPVAGGDAFQDRYLESAYGIGLASGTARLNDSVLELLGDAACSVGPGGTLLTRDAAMLADSGAVCPFSVGGTMDWDGTHVIGAENGLELAGASGSISRGASLESPGDGLRAAGDLSSLEVSFLLVDGSVGNGAVFDGASGALIRNLTVENSGLQDVVARNGSTVELRDAAFDDSKVSVEAGSQVTRSWTRSYVVVSSDSSAMEGASVFLLDAMGDTVSAGATDSVGFTSGIVLTGWVNSGGAVASFNPYQVHVSYGAFDSTFTDTVDAQENPEILLPASAITGVGGGPGDGAGAPFLAQNVPNPVRATTAIRYRTTGTGRVTLSIFDVAGREVARVVDTIAGPGEYDAVWRPGPRVPGGVYFYRLRAPGVSATRKLLLLK